LTEEDQSGGLVKNKVIHTLGNIGRRKGEVLLKLLTLPVFETLSHLLEDGEYVSPAITALCALSMDTQGLVLLTNNLDIVKEMGFHLQDTDLDTKLAGYYAFTQIFENFQQSSHGEVGKCKIIYENMLDDPETTQFILETLKKPFFDVRKAAYAMLKAIAAFDWGIMHIIQVPGFLEHLLNRNVETVTEGFSWKYNILQCITENSNVRNILSPEQYYAILFYLKCGIIHVPAVSAPLVKEEVS